MLMEMIFQIQKCSWLTLSEGDTYFNALRKKIEELFPPEVQ
jgi:hypothetical protein